LPFLSTNIISHAYAGEIKKQKKMNDDDNSRVKNKLQQKGFHY